MHKIRNIGEAVGVRGNEPSRYRAYVVEGRESKHPGRIRSINIDNTHRESAWLRTEWELENGAPRRLVDATLTKAAKSLGCFLLLDAYDDDPDPIVRTKGKTAWLEYNQQRANGKTKRPFPDALLPAKVRELQKLTREDLEWVPPTYEELAKKAPKAKADA